MFSLAHFDIELLLRRYGIAKESALRNKQLADFYATQPGEEERVEFHTLLAQDVSEDAQIFWSTLYEIKLEAYITNNMEVVDLLKTI